MKMNVNSATFGYLQDRSTGTSPPTCAYKAAGRGVGARAAGEGGGREVEGVEEREGSR